MRKADIVKLAKSRRNGQQTKSPGEAIASDAREAPQERAEREAVNLTPETCRAIGEAVAVAVCSRLARLLPVAARIAAADTVHTMHQPPTVFRHAIDEGIAAANILEAVQ